LLEVLARSWRCRIVVSGVVSGCLTLVASGAATAAALPNPCALLTAVHAEKTLAKGKSVVVKHGKLVKSGSGSFVRLTCSEMVGTQPVFLTLSHSSGGFGGVKITSTTHPSGLGSGDQLVVGTGPTGAPVDFIVFHKAGVFADISANGANPGKLTTLARQLFKLIR
jgi:hypothetical protein